MDREYELKQILGDWQEFFALQKNRLAELDIPVADYSISHLAFRTETLDDYLSVRGRLEPFCAANVENVWNGRPISKLLLESPLDLGGDFDVSLIELIPPKHQRVYKMGFEHVGFVLGDRFDEFSRTKRSKLTGQQFQSPVCEPAYILFEDYSHVKFYRHSLMDVCVKEGQVFDGFVHAIESSEDLTR